MLKVFLLAILILHIFANIQKQAILYSKSFPLSKSSMRDMVS